MPTASDYTSIDMRIVLGALFVTIVGVLMVVALYLFIIAFCIYQHQRERSRYGDVRNT
jgi:hypothetical protein